jgi:hypothetical protein
MKLVLGNVEITMEQPNILRCARRQGEVGPLSPLEREETVVLQQNMRAYVQMLYGKKRILTTSHYARVEYS